MAGIKLTNLPSTPDYSVLFSSLNKANGVEDTNLFADWASIQNGSYGKLTKAYYSKKSPSSEGADSEQTEAVRQNNILKNNVQGLEKDASSIRDDRTLFSVKVTTKDENGNEKDDYNYDKIYKQLKSFVSSYNSVIKRGAEAESNATLRNTLLLTKVTANNSKKLEEVGITVGGDNLLSIDEETVKSADILKLRQLFSGVGSYVDSVDSIAGNIENAINADTNKQSNYTSSGAYQAPDIAGSVFDGNY